VGADEARASGDEGALGVRGHQGYAIGG
jgi:hypothetical protein